MLFLPFITNRKWVALPQNLSAVKTEWFALKETCWVLLQKDSHTRLIDATPISDIPIPA